MVEIRLNSAFGLSEYVQHFKNNDITASPGHIRMDSRYFTDRSSEIYRQIAELDARPNVPDTILEFALMSYFTATVNIRLVQAAEMLPANSRESDLKLGAAVFQEIQILRFLASSADASTGSATATAAVGRHEGILRFITDRGNVTRAEVEAHYRAGIRGLISETVDECFNEIYFFLRNVIGSTDNSFSAVLTRNMQNGRYTLRYESRTRNINEELSAQTLEALLSAMSRSREFSQDAINKVRAQAALIPAVTLSSREIGYVKDIITAFYLNPNTTTYTAVRDVLALYNRSMIGARSEAYHHITGSYIDSLVTLNEALSGKVVRDCIDNIRVISGATSVEGIHRTIR